VRISDRQRLVETANLLSVHEDQKMPGKIQITMTVNGEKREILCQPFQTLLEVLRDELKLTGTKEGCSNGNCGACSVILNGLLVNSCIVLAAEANGGRVETIEGLATAEGLHPIQQAFLENAALQCGICTPGYIMAAKALLAKKPAATEAQIRHWCAGNLCRCTGYDKIVRAIHEVEDRMSVRS
jgi:aerobic carbon-monoxide dehydrogenase small subunit